MHAASGSCYWACAWRGDSERRPIAAAGSPAQEHTREPLSPREASGEQSASREAERRLKDAPELGGLLDGAQHQAGEEDDARRVGCRAEQLADLRGSPPPREDRASQPLCLLRLGPPADDGPQVVEHRLDRAARGGQQEGSVQAELNGGAVWRRRADGMQEGADARRHALTGAPASQPRRLLQRVPPHPAPLEPGAAPFQVRRAQLEHAHADGPRRRVVRSDEVVARRPRRPVAHVLKPRRRRRDALRDQLLQKGATARPVAVPNHDEPRARAQRLHAPPGEGAARRGEVEHVRRCDNVGGWQRRRLVADVKD
mmetsp:Transcript_52202/g.174282  ORF Transcript_52202/g.174282 Transcript_52202/m.174282 type:complete len:313 (-) Transcript_52202:540-1478(-)